MKSLQNKIDNILRNSNHLAWLNDYKIYGYKSYVYQDKNILHELYEDYTLCMNDDMIKDEVFDYVISINKDVGKAISSFYGINSKYELSLLHNINDVVNNLIAINAILEHTTAMNFMINKSTFMNAVANSELAMSVISNNEDIMNTIVNNTIAMSAVANSEIAMNAIYSNQMAITIISNSSNAMTIITKCKNAIRSFLNSNLPWSLKKIFITALNSKQNYLNNLNNVLNTTEYFSKKYTSSLQTSSSSSLSTFFSKYTTSDYVGNGLIAISLGVNTSYGPTTGSVTSRVSVNGDVIKEIKYGDSNCYGNPKTTLPTSSTPANAIVIAPATVESVHVGAAVITVYTVV